jgi:phytanoyl-CoA hydroxylase
MCEGLTPQQVAQFHEDGYLVLPGFASLDTTKGLIARANQLVSDFDPSVVSIFSTKDNNQAHAKDAYFLDSDQQISFFFEEKAFTDGKLTTPKATAINKIGHALHVLDPAFHAFSSSPAMAAILRSLGYRRPVPVQSMYIFKQPHIGGEVVPHQVRLSVDGGAGARQRLGVGGWARAGDG